MGNHGERRRRRRGGDEPDGSLAAESEREVGSTSTSQVRGLPQGLMSFRAFRMRAGSQGVKQRRRSHHHATAGGKPPANHAGIPRNLGPMHSTALRARARISGLGDRLGGGTLGGYSPLQASLGMGLGWDDDHFTTFNGKK